MESVPDLNNLGPRIWENFPNPSVPMHWGCLETICAARLHMWFLKVPTHGDPGV